MQIVRAHMQEETSPTTSGDISQTCRKLSVKTRKKEESLTQRLIPRRLDGLLEYNVTRRRKSQLQNDYQELKEAKLNIQKKFEADLQVEKELDVPLIKHIERLIVSQNEVSETCETTEEQPKSLRKGMNKTNALLNNEL